MEGKDESLLIVVVLTIALCNFSDTPDRSLQVVLLPQVCACFHVSQP